MAYTKLKNAYLLVDAMNALADAEDTAKNFPAHQIMVEYWRIKVEELTKRVYR